MTDTNDYGCDNNNEMFKDKLRHMGSSGIMSVQDQQSLVLKVKQLSFPNVVYTSFDNKDWKPVVPIEMIPEDVSTRGKANKDSHFLFYGNMRLFCF